MINSGEIRNLRGNTLYCCHDISSLLTGDPGKDLIFALSPPTDAARQGLHTRLLQSAHHARQRHDDLSVAFPPALFRNANWTIMLSCFIALLEGRTLCVKEIQCTLQESHTAVLRHIDALDALGLIGRKRDNVDGRRTLVLLSAQGVAAMVRYLDGPAFCAGKGGVPALIPADHLTI